MLSRRLARAVAIGLATGVIGTIGAVVPPVAALEDSIGLRSLFLARGPVAPPAGVVVVNLDRSASVRAGLPPAVRDWPRSAHAQLIDRLVDRGAATIAFDVQFLRHSASPAEDDVLARAISRAGNVVLAQRLEVVRSGDTEFWRTQDPIPELARAAAAMGPASLPDTAVVTWFWAVQDIPGAGRTLTLPASAARRHTMSLAGTGSPITPADTAYLNFYGPPGTICTWSYSDVVAGDGSGAEPCSLRGALVFVGLGHSALADAGQQDTHHTIYENDEGVDFTGVELHATAAANLLSGTALRAPAPAVSVLVLLLVGAAGAAGYWVRSIVRWTAGRLTARAHAAGVIVAAFAAYAGVAYLLFTQQHIVLPLVVPLAVQAPLALVLVLLTPPTVRVEQARAVCVATDADGSTALGQRLSHREYASVMNRYVQALAQPVWVRGGAALSPQGDGFIGLWRAGDEPGSDADRELRAQACHAALAIAGAAAEFNSAQSGGETLPTRIGVTVGSVTVHADADRGIGSAFGDAINVAARLRDANRELGTRVLASSEVAADLASSTIEARRLVSTLTLKGVENAAEVFELVRRTG